MAYSLGFAHGRITLSYNGGPAAAQLRADLLRMQAAARSAHGSIRSFGERMDKMNKGLIAAAKHAGKGALAISGLHSAIGAVVAVAGGLVNLTPVLVAGLSTIPAIVFGAAVAFGVFKIATMGMADALKAAGGDAKEFESAIKNLPPEAQKFARAWRTAGQSLKPVQQAMQNAFFSGTGNEITKIAKAALGLKKEAVGVADGFNQVFRRLLEFGSSIPFIVAVRESLKGVRGFLLAISAGVGPLLTGFSRLATQAAGFAGALGNNIALAMIKFGNTLSGMNLAVVFDNAKAVLQPIIELLGHIGSIIATVFGALQTEGAGLFGVLGEMVKQLDLFLKTAEGQEALTALSTAFSTIAGATGEVFMTLLKELAPVIVALAPGLAQFALILASTLVPVLETLGPILTSVAGFLTDNMNIVGPLIIGIYALAGAMKVYNAASKAAVVIQRLWNSTMVQSLLLWVRTTAATVAASVATAYHAVVTRVVAAATRIWTAIQAAWGVVMAISTAPITLIILAIAALIIIIVLIATKTDWFQKAWAWAWGLIKDTALAVWGWLRDTLWPGIKWVWDQLYKIVMTNVQGMKQIFMTIWDAIKSVISFFVRLNEAAFEKLDQLIAFVKSLPGRIGDAIGNLGRMLYDKGKSLVQGFIDGIKSMFGAVGDIAKNLVGSVTKFLPGSPAEVGPLSGRGWTPYRGKSLVSGLAKGMQDGLRTLEKVSTQVAITAAPVLPSAVGEAGLSAGFIPGAVQAAAAAQSHSEPVTIQTLNVNLQGVWDMNDPQASRRIAVKVHEEIERVKGQYR